MSLTERPAEGKKMTTYRSTIDQDEFGNFTARAYMDTRAVRLARALVGRLCDDEGLASIETAPNTVVTVTTSSGRVCDIICSSAAAAERAAASLRCMYGFDAQPTRAYREHLEVLVRAYAPKVA